MATVYKRYTIPCCHVAQGMLTRLRVTRQWSKDTEEGTAMVAKALSRKHSDLREWYIGCSLGLSKIGLICICFGSVSALSCLSLAYITKHVHRVPIICAGAVFSAGLLLVLRIWKPRPVDQANFYVIAGCSGLCDAIWQTQAYALFGKLFMDKQEAAFATYRMFHATGCALAFGYSYFLCVATKIYILCAVLVCSLLGYGITEVKLHNETHHMSDIVAL